MINYSYVNYVRLLYILTVTTRKRTGDTVLNLTDVPSWADEDSIEHYFTKKCSTLGGGEVKVLSFSEDDNYQTVVSIKQLSSEGN